MMDEMQDIELDADVHQSSMSGGPQTVRKSISLNLTKKTKLKRNEVKSSKSKKERRDRDEDSDSKGSRRSKMSEKRKDANDDDDREDEELDWSHKVIFIGEKVQDPMIHVCEKCTLPILIYGRLSPCKHVFCLSCAEKSNGSCSRCDERIDRIEPAGIGQIFVCSFGGSRNGISGCRRSYLSQRDLFAHIKHRHEKEGSTIPETELVRQQGVVRMPFLNATPGMIVQPGLNIQSAGQTAGLGGAVVLAGIQPGSQQPIVVDPNRVPLIMGTQAQFSSITQGLITQSPFPGATYFPQGLPAQMSGLPSSGGGSRQGDLPPPSRSGGMQRVSSVRQHGEWRGGDQLPPSAQDWANQGRSGNYQQQYYK